MRVQTFFSSFYNTLFDLTSKLHAACFVEKENRKEDKLGQVMQKKEPVTSCFAEKKSKNPENDDRSRQFIIRPITEVIFWSFL